MVRTLVLSIFSCLGNLAFTPEQLPVQQVEIISTLPTSTNEISRIYFIHNAESEYSAKDEHGTKFTSGRSPMVSLSERGREQADRLGALLSSRIEQAIVFIPPAKRAEETASFLLSKSITMGLYCEGLFEVGMGDWEGKPKDQLYKTEHQKWKSLSAAEKYTTPRVTSGESYQEAAHRAIYELEGIVQENPGKNDFYYLWGKSSQCSRHSLDKSQSFERIWLRSSYASYGKGRFFSRRNPSWPIYRTG